MLTLRIDGQVIHIPIEECSHNGTHFIPARCEVIRKIKLNISEPSLLLQQEIGKGIFIPNTVIDENTSHLRILNTSNTPQTFSVKSIKIFSLTEFNQVNQNSSDPFESNRIAQLHEILKDTYPQHISNKLKNLLSKFADIFHIEGDKATVNNFYEQK